jgi:hypothetical protein
LPDHRLIVAYGFRIAGWAVGGPSALAAIALGAGALVVGARPADHAASLSVTTYGLAGLLSNAANGVGGVLSFLGGIAAWLLGLLAVAALLAALFGALLYVLGRGLRASAGWARILAIALTAAAMPIGLLALAVLEGGTRLVDVTILAALAYALWALGWRFKTSG